MGNLLKNKNAGYIFIIFLFLVFWILSTISIDPDFGWRLKAGEIYSGQGIPATDPFSYTMPSFAWSDHAWIVTAGIGLTYKYIGKSGLALISVVIVFIALHLSAGRIEKKKILKTLYLNRFFDKRFWYFGSFLFLLAVSAVLPFSGVRAQVVSWLMTAILLAISLNEDLWLRLRKYSPIFFIAWSNLHGSFTAGLAILVFINLVQFYRRKKIDGKSIAIIFLSALSTLINPNGVGVWSEAWSSITDSSLRWEIAEWMPAFFMADFSFAAFLTVSCVLVWRHKSKYQLEEILLFFLVLSQALLSRRHIPIWIIVALPMSLHALYYLYEEIKEIKKAPERFQKLMQYAYIGSMVILILQLVLNTKDAAALSEGNFYPDGAVHYLANNTPSGEIFSEYGWGGYLIWKLPEKKVFIDGRMPSWRWKEAPSNESTAAYIDYKEIIKGEKDYEKTFEKYGIDTVLWPLPRKKGVIDNIADKIEKLLINIGKKEEGFDLSKKLENEGWIQVYKDSISVIYQR